MTNSSLSALTDLPRPVYGHAESITNQALNFEHAHPWWQFSYASHGILEIHTADGKFVAPPQRAVWIPPTVLHQVRCFSQATIRSLYIQPNALQLPNRHCQVVAVNALLSALIQRFSQLPTHYPQHGAEARLVAVLLDELTTAPPSDSMLPLPTDCRLRHITEHLEHTPDDATSLAAWAHQLTLSEKTLSRLFKQQTGLSFRQWRQRLRLLSALPLLEQKTSVTEVSFICGYDSVSAFISAFKDYFGKTPGDFFE